MVRQIAERGKEIFHPLDNAVHIIFLETLETLTRFTQILSISTIPKIHHTKLHLMMNLMIYVFRSRCKCFSPRTWSNFVKFDFSINLYAMDRREYLSRERSSVCEGERVSVQKVCVCVERKGHHTIK